MIIGSRWPGRSSTWSSASRTLASLQRGEGLDLGDDPLGLGQGAAFALAAARASSASAMNRASSDI